MKKTACIYTSNTGVGLITDVDLIQDLLCEDYDIDVVFFNKALKPVKTNKFGNDIYHTRSLYGDYDIGIFLQDWGEEWIDRNKINILIANEEWIGEDKLLQLNYFNKIITKSTFAKQLLTPYNQNIVTTGFISPDKNNSNINPTKTFLHLAGRSLQKGTESIINSFTTNNLDLTMLQSYHTYNNVPTNVNHIRDFLSAEDINNHLNTHSIHLCPSIYEGWGHYLYEGMSTGGLIYATKIPMFIEWIDPDLVVFLDCVFHKTNKELPFLKSNWPHQFGWVVNDQQLTDAINNYKKHLENHNPDKVRQFFKHINQKNSKKLYTELTNI